MNYTQHIGKLRWAWLSLICSQASSVYSSLCTHNTGKAWAPGLIFSEPSTPVSEVHMTNSH